MSANVRCVSCRRRMRPLRAAPLLALLSTSGAEPVVPREESSLHGSSVAQPHKHKRCSAFGRRSVAANRRLRTPLPERLRTQRRLPCLRPPGFRSGRTNSKALGREVHLGSLRFWAVRLASGEPVLHTLESMKDSPLLQVFGSTAQGQPATARRLLRVRGPNPSIERTCPSRLRLLAPAAHVKR